MIEFFMYYAFGVLVTFVMLTLLARKYENVRQHVTMENAPFIGMIVLIFPPFWVATVIFLISTLVVYISNKGKQ